MIDKVPHPAFTLHFGGCDLQGHERMGEQVGAMLQEQIPAFLVELGKAVENSGMNYQEWIECHEEDAKEIAKKYLA